MTDSVAALNKLDPSQLRFRHFKDLRSGLDRFSRMTLAKLVELGDPSVREVCALLLPDTDEKYVTIACRWAARGLRPDLAIRKVCTDGSVASAAIRRAIRARVGHRKRERPTPKAQREMAVFE